MPVPIRILVVALSQFVALHWSVLVLSLGAWADGALQSLHQPFRGNSKKSCFFPGKLV